MNTLYAFFMSFLAGISTLLGVIPIYIKIKGELIHKLFILSFITLVFISLFELLPDGFKLILGNNSLINTILITIISFFTGFTLTFLLDKKIGEGSSNFFKIGIINMIAMIIHNMLEGIISFITTLGNIKVGILICFLIMMHNIPEGIIISLPIYYGKKNRGLALLLTTISASSELLGALLSYFFLFKYINNTIFGILYIITSGIMIFVSIYELLPIICNKYNFKI